MIAEAVTGPTSGSASSSTSVAVLRLTRATGAPAVGTADAASPVGAGTPTRICSPSTSSRARFSDARSTPGRAPPAALIASTTREPASSTAMPGRRTFPATSTVTVPEVAAPEPVAPAGVGAGDAGSVGDTGTSPASGETSVGAATWVASPRTTHQQVTARPTTTSTAITLSWADPRATRPRRVSGTSTAAPAPLRRAA